MCEHHKWRFQAILGSECSGNTVYKTKYKIETAARCFAKQIHGRVVRKQEEREFQPQKPIIFTPNSNKNDGH